MKKIIIPAQVTLLLLIFFFLLFPKENIHAQNKVVTTNNQTSQTSLRFESGSVNPMHGGSGSYTFQTILINPKGIEPDYVKIFIMKGDSKSKFQSYPMIKGPFTPQGTTYQFKKEFTEKDEGIYEFYFEAKFGQKTIHGPSYGGENCEPGMCAACCGAWGGPKIMSAKLIEENKIYLFQKDNDSPIWSFSAGKNWITSIKFSPDEQNFAAADNNQHLYFFDIASNKPKWTFTGSAKEGSELGMDKGLAALSKNGYLAASLRGIVYLFKINSNKPLWSYPTTMVLNGLVISEDGNYIAAAGRDTNVYLWKKDSSTPVWTHKIEAKGGLHGGSVIISMAMTPDGKYFVAGTSCPDRSVHVFTPSQPDEIYQAKAGANFPVGTVSIADNGQYFLAGGGGDPEDPYTAILYKVGRSGPVWRFDFSRNPVSEVAISADGKSCAIGSNMDGLILTACSSKDPLWQLRNSGYISGVIFSKDGSLVAAGSGTNHVFLLPADGSKIIKDWQIENKVESLDLSASGKYIAVGTGLNRFFFSSQEGVNTSGAGGGEVKEVQPQLINFQNSKNSSNKISYNLNQTTSQTQLPYILLIAGCVISSICFITYLALTRMNSLKKYYNKKVTIILGLVTGLFIITIVVVNFLTLSKLKKQGQPVKTVQPNSQNTSSIDSSNKKGTYQEGKSGTCGNHVCEAIAGETKESCSQDCLGNVKSR